MAFKTGLLPADLIPQNNQCSVERSNGEKLLEAFNFLGGFHDQAIHAIGALGGLQLLARVTQMIFEPVPEFLFRNNFDLD